MEFRDSVSLRRGMAETAEGAPRQFVVRRVSSRGGAQVWVEWLGYPDDRSCWRSLTEHLKKPASCSGSGGGAASGGGGEGGGSVERLAGVHADDRPVGLRVRLLTTSEAAAALSAGNFLRGCPLRPVVNPGGAKGGGGVKKRVKKDKQKVYETKVHRILVGSSGVSEIREIKRSGHGIKGARTTVQSVIKSGGGSDLGSAAGGGGKFDDDRSALWAQHRLLNQDLYCRPHGAAFKLEIASNTEEEVILNWTFPVGCPGDYSAWVGIFDADFDWPRAASRPKHVRYKMLSSSKQQGQVRFSARDLANLEGNYLFSLNTGNLNLEGANGNAAKNGGGAAGGGGEPNYCVSQRIKMVDEKVVKVVGRAHGAVIPPPRNFDSSRLLAKAAKAAEKSNEIGDNEEETSEEEEDPELLFPVPLLEHEDLDDEREDLKQVYALVDRLSYLDWGLGSRDEVRSGRRGSASSAPAAPLGGEGQNAPDALLGEGAAVPAKNCLTANTSEGYGEATCATAERLFLILSKLTACVPAMRGWETLWNLNQDASFLDIGSGYGKVCVHAKLSTLCRQAHGVECVANRVEISNLALQGLFGELDRAALDDEILKASP